jgi:hypothetical protein
MHDGDHATLHDARTYVEGVVDMTPPGEPRSHSHRAP